MRDEITAGMRVLGTEAELREFVKPPHESIANKGTDHIDEQSRRFIEASPFFLLATADEEGNVDVSPRGDPAGSVLVLDDKRLAIADRRGNRRLDSMRNILSRPRVGTLFIIPGVNETLRVNGRASIVTGAPFLERMTVQGKTPDLAIVVEVEELFLHCAKAFLRSSLWDHTTWPDRRNVPSAGSLVRSQQGDDRIDEAEVNAALDRDARENQY
ncbi:hypothetical protein HNP84_008822 [Thermocatellispora tengchongensis]|uniref:Pyridoxamine 5'-phosphate oxidase N-terminal domain-containing protein n=1 Tax=Thermocatellispora tengchongensis TaxID=1073253 RepID=A0A840PJB9_9ACTN|nr:pyridoxamine 5'-phosphate oxidase family protein [Thermocatellispora tengchongensis]MBB5139059.1 hypothetical protein [Thermocatellispora tengchongensis]